MTGDQAAAKPLTISLFIGENNLLTSYVSLLSNKLNISNINKFTSKQKEISRMLNPSDGRERFRISFNDYCSALTCGVAVTSD